MLKVYTGYNLSSIRDAVSFNFTDLTIPKEIIESVTEKVLSTDCFSDNGVELKVKTNHPLVLGVLETLAMECEVVIGEYFPNKELTDLKSRFYSYYYKNIRRLGRGD